MRKMLMPLALVGGGVAGLLRAVEWRLAWDKELGLMAPHHYSSLLLLGFSLLFAAAVFLGLRAVPKTSLGAAAPGRVRSFPVMDALAVLVLLASASADLYEFISLQTSAESFQGLSTLIFAVMTFFSALCVLVVAWAATQKTMPHRAYGIYMLVPVFWACFWLIRNIGKYAINPVPLSYFYDMMAAIFTLLALYSVAGFFFGRPRPRQLLLFSGLGVYFALTTLLGLLLYWVLWGGFPTEGLNAGELFRLLFPIFHLAAVMRAAGGRAGAPPRHLM